MTETEETRIERLMREYYAKTEERVDALERLIVDRASECVADMSRLVSLESWRARAEKSEDSARVQREAFERETREMNLKQLEMLNAQNVAFQAAEAKRDGAREEAARARAEAARISAEAGAKLARNVKIGISILAAICSGIGWLISHRI